MTILQNLYDRQRVDENEARLKMPLRGVVNRTIPSLEAVEVDYALQPGTARLKIRHPYYGPNSWIRVIPEEGTSVTTQQRGDTVHDDIFGYLAGNAPDRIQKFQEGIGLYRLLDVGEIEIMSKGRAYAHFGSGGDIEFRGGVVRQDLQQSRMELRAQAPTYSRRLHRAQSSTLKHQEKFGVIKRPDPKFPSVLEQYIKTTAGDFQYEYVRMLHDKDDKALAELQEGVVVDETGQVEQQSSTSKNLRYRKRLVHVNGQILSMEVDEELNILVNNSSQAPETKLILGAQNVLSITCRDTKFFIDKTGTEQYGTSLTVTSPTMTYNASTSYTVKSNKAHLNAPLTQFGSNPTLPIALAGPTMTFLTAAMSTVQAAMQVMGADPGISAPTKAAATTAATALASMISTIQNIPSTQVFASG